MVVILRPIALMVVGIPGNILSLHGSCANIAKLSFFSVHWCGLCSTLPSAVLPGVEHATVRVPPKKRPALGSKPPRTWRICASIYYDAWKKGNNTYIHPNLVVKNGDIMIYPKTHMANGKLPFFFEWEDTSSNGYFHIDHVSFLWV